jgi:hypothetical protein
MLTSLVSKKVQNSNINDCRLIAGFPAASCSACSMATSLDVLPRAQQCALLLLSSAMQHLTANENGHIASSC